MSVSPSGWINENVLEWLKHSRNYNRVTRPCFRIVIRHTKHFVSWSFIMRTTEEQYIIMEMY
jgi:hypothetical protein